MENNILCKELGFPKIGDVITPINGFLLCQSFKLDYLVNRLRDRPHIQYKEWEFDGASCIPDKWLGIFNRGKWKLVTFKCALPHDLGYAYGELGNKKERKKVDKRFRNNLIEKANYPKFIAWGFYIGVRIGGMECLKLPWTWGFANKLR